MSSVTLLLTNLVGDSPKLHWASVSPSVQELHLLSLKGWEAHSTLDGNADCWHIPETLILTALDRASCAAAAGALGLRRCWSVLSSPAHKCTQNKGDIRAVFSPPECIMRASMAVLTSLGLGLWAGHRSALLQSSCSQGLTAELLTERASSEVPFLLAGSLMLLSNLGQRMAFFYLGFRIYFPVSLLQFKMKKKNFFSV